MRTEPPYDAIRCPDICPRGTPYRCQLEEGHEPRAHEHKPTGKTYVIKWTANIVYAEPERSKP